MGVLNKAEVTLGKIPYHLRVAPGDGGKYVLLPGDPARSDRVARYLDDARARLLMKLKICAWRKAGIKKYRWC